MSTRFYGGRLRAELVRERTRALALQFDVEADPMWFDAPEGPSSLGPLVRRELERRGLRGAEHKIRDLVAALARWALRRDPSTRVAAGFAVETALDLVAQKSLRGDDAAASYRNGMPSARCSTAYSGSDLSRLRALPSALADVRTAVMQARWRPEHETAGHLYDPVRPLAEALAAAALHIEQTDGALAMDAAETCRTARRVLGVGLGLTAGPQALSAMLPDATVFCDAAPFHSAPLDGAAWSAAVLNVPRASAYLLAEQLGAGGSDSEVSLRVFGETRSRARRNLDPRIDHVPGIAARLVGRVSGKTTVVVLCDPEVQLAVEAALGEAGLCRRELCLAEHRVSALYVGSGLKDEGQRRRARGLPRPTARIVTAWELEQ